MKLFNIKPTLIKRDFGEIEVVELGSFFEKDTKKLHLPISRLHPATGLYELTLNRVGNMVIKEVIQSIDNSWMIQMRLKSKSKDDIKNVALLIPVEFEDKLTVIGYKLSEFNYYENGKMKVMTYHDYLFTAQQGVIFKTINTNKTDIMYFYTDTDKVKLYKSLEELKVSHNIEDTLYEYTNILDLFYKKAL